MPTRIQIFGLRCSGTNYLDSLILKNYQDVELVFFLGHKHLWKAELNPPRYEPDIVIIISRNPYDWLRSVHREPHHCPDLIGNSFSNFIRNPWLAYKGEQWNSPIRSIRNALKKKENLREHFNSVLSMRNAKNAAFCVVKKTYNNCVCIDLNDLQEHPQQTLSFLTERFGVQPLGTFQNIKRFKKTNSSYKVKKRIRICKNDLNHIRNHLNWESEAQLLQKEDSYGYDNIIPWYRYKFLLRQFKNDLLQIKE